MDENTKKSKPASTTGPVQSTGSGWAVFWLIVCMLAGFASAGIYMHERLTQLENKIVTQTEKVASQSEDTLVTLHNTRKDILANRAETASFAKQFSSSVEELSSLMSDTVQNFSTQTSELAKAIEQKDTSQEKQLKNVLAKLSERTEEQAQQIQKQVSSLSQELQLVKNDVISTKEQTQKMDSQMTALNDQIIHINKDLTTRVASLSELTQNLNTVINAKFKENSDSLKKEIASLQSASEKSMADIQSQLSSFTDQMQQQDSSENQKIAALDDKLGQTLSAIEQEQKADEQSIGALRSTVAQLEQKLAKQNRTIQENLASFSQQIRVVSENLSMDFASTQKDQEVLQTQLAELSYAVAGQNEELLTSLSEVKQQNQSLIESTRNAILTKVEHVNNLLQGSEQLANASSLDTALKNLVQMADARFAETIEDQFTTWVDTLEKKINEVAFSTQTAKTEEVLKQIKALKEQAVSIRSSLLDGIEKTQARAQAFISDPKSDQALQEFQSAMEELSASIHSTQDQMKSIQDLISSIEPADQPNTEKIGMAPTHADS